MKQTKTSLDEELLLLQLKDILLQEDREALQKLQASFNDEKEMEERISPIIQQHLAFVKENFKQEYGVMINEIVREKLIASQDDIVNIIYPKLDVMIKKYITAAFQQLKENIDGQLGKVKRTFSPREIISRFWGPKESDIVLSNLDHPIIHEIYVVQRDSGLLLGSYSRTKNIDQDVIAGMLTAIKSFVEDAFHKGQEDLEMIQYENYKIFLQNLPSYYFAVAINGSMSAVEKDNLSSNLINFAQKEMPFLIEDIDETLTEGISKKLELHFEELTAESVQI